MEQSEHIGLWLDADLLQFVGQAEIPEHLDCVRAHLDAGSNLSQLGRLFEYANPVSALQQARGSRQASDAGTGNKYSSVVSHGYRSYSGRTPPIALRKLMTMPSGVGVVDSIAVLPVE